MPTKYDFSEFAEPQEDAQQPVAKNKYDFSEFSAPEESKEPAKTNKTEGKKQSLRDMMLDVMSGKTLDKSGKFTAPIGLGQIIIRAAPHVAEDIYNTGKAGLSALFEGGPGAAKQIAQDPMRAGRNAGAGMVEQMRNIAAIPHNLPDYLAKLELLDPESAKKISGYIPEPPDITQKANNFVGGKQTPADKLIRGAFGNALVVAPVAKALTGAGATAAKTAAGFPGKIIGKTDPIISAQESLLEQNIKDKIGEKIAAKKTHLEQLEEYNKAISESNNKLKMTNADKMEHNLNKHNEQLNEVKFKADELEQQLLTDKPPEAPEPLDIEKPQMDQQHLENVENANNAVTQAKENIGRAEEHHENVQNIANETEGHIAEHLNEGAAHHRTVGRFLKKRIENLMSGVQSRYKKFVDNTKDTHYQMPNTVQYSVDMEDVMRQLRAGVNPGEVKSATLDNKELQHIIDQAPTSKDKTASDFLTKYKDFRDARYNAKQRMKNASSAEERRQLAEAYEQSKPMETVVKKTLEDGLGPYKVEFDAVNKGYTDIFYPLKQNATARKIVKKAKMSKNMLEELTSDEPGHEILRTEIKNNPEMARHVVGQRYEVNPSEIHNPNELLSEYTKDMPELQRMTETRNEAHNEIYRAKQHVETAKQHYAIANERHAEAKANLKKATEELKPIEAEYKAKVGEHTKKEIAYERELKTHNKKIEDTKTQIEQYQKDIQKHESKIATYEDQIKKVREQFNKKENSLKEKNRLGLELDTLRHELSMTRKKLASSTTGMKKAWLVTKVLYRAAKKLKGL